MNCNIRKGLSHPQGLLCTSRWRKFHMYKAIGSCFLFQSERDSPVELIGKRHLCFGTRTLHSGQASREGPQPGLEMLPNSRFLNIASRSALSYFHHHSKPLPNTCGGLSWWWECHCDRPLGQEVTAFFKDGDWYQVPQAGTIST